MLAILAANAITNEHFVSFVIRVILAMEFELVFILANGWL